MSMNRRHLIAGLAAAPFAAPFLATPAFAQAGLSPQDQALVDRATGYLQGLTEAKARFSQTDARGGRTAGTVYLRRPGKARFEYDPPSGLLVVSDGSTVAVRDSRLKTFDRYPLAATPLSLFLARNIRFDRNVTIASVQKTAGGFTIVARDSTRKAAGQIALAFADGPLRLTGWTVTDAQSRPTHVKLSGLAPSKNPNALFVLTDPRQGAGRARM